MTSNDRGERDGSDPKGRNPDFRVLDPELRYPGYWVRFRGRVMERAADGLRRRRLKEVGVVDLLQSWARWLVPAAAVASVVAGTLLSRSTPILAIGVEETLRIGLEDQTLPDLMDQDAFGDPFLLIDETF